MNRIKKACLFFHLCLDPFTPLCHAIEKLSPILQHSKMTFVFQRQLDEKSGKTPPTWGNELRHLKYLDRYPYMSPQFSQSSLVGMLRKSHLSLFMSLASIFFLCSLQWESLSWKPACSPSVMPSLEVDGVLSAAQPDRTTGAIFIRGKANINK